MMPTLLLHGTADGVLATVEVALRDAGCTTQTGAPASLLVNLGGPADRAIAAAESFAAHATPVADALVINMLHNARDWPGTELAETLWAFTRHAALAWAPRRIRVNAIGLGISPLLAAQATEAAGQAAGPAPATAAIAADVAGTILAMWRFQSMTGQLIRLGA